MAHSVAAAPRARRRHRRQAASRSRRGSGTSGRPSRSRLSCGALGIGETSSGSAVGKRSESLRGGKRYAPYSISI